MQYRFDNKVGNPLGQFGAARQMSSMVVTVIGIYLPAHDPAAVQIQNQVQVKPATNHGSGQLRHIPAPDLANPGGDVGGGWTYGSGGLGASTVDSLPVCVWHSCKRGYAGHVPTHAMCKHWHVFTSRY